MAYGRGTQRDTRRSTEWHGEVLHWNSAVSKQTDLRPVLGRRAQVSEIVSGKRGIGKAQAKKLAEFFHTSADLP